MDEQQLRLFRTEVYQKLTQLDKNKELGPRGRKIREELGWTQKFVAELVQDTTAAHISEWETGRRTPQGELAMKYLIVIEAMEEMNAGKR